MRVLIIGGVAGGSQRWINLGFMQLQPSEFMKPIIVLAVARFYAMLPVGEIRRYLAKFDRRNFKTGSFLTVLRLLGIFFRSILTKSSSGVVLPPLLKAYILSPVMRFAHKAGAKHRKDREEQMSNFDGKSGFSYGRGVSRSTAAIVTATSSGSTELILS